MELAKEGTFPTEIQRGQLHSKMVDLGIYRQLRKVPGPSDNMVDCEDVFALRLIYYAQAVN